jgi:ESCRT-II complex subunit VPS36
MITLTDAYCRVNRARGLELLSPEDLLNACNNFPSESNIPLRLHTFETTGVSVIQLVSCFFQTFLPEKKFNTFEIESYYYY